MAHHPKHQNIQRETVYPPSHPVHAGQAGEADDTRDPDGRIVAFVKPGPLPTIQNLRPVLRGKTFELRFLEADDFEGLLAASADPELFRFYTHSYHSREALKSFVDDALSKHKTGQRLPFVIRRIADGEILGTSSFLNIDSANRRLEIGSTWYKLSAQGTSLNSEAKLLLLSYAFEELDCIRVEFKTDSFNLRSRAALAAIGAVEEGVFRNHMIAETGRVRHSVYFAIAKGDWPQVKTRLRERLAAREAQDRKI